MNAPVSIDHLRHEEIRNWLERALRGQETLPLLTRDEFPHLGILRLEKTLKPATRDSLRDGALQLVRQFCVNGRGETAYAEELLALATAFKHSEAVQMLAQLAECFSGLLHVSTEIRLAVLAALIDMSPPQPVEFWEHIFEQDPKQYAGLVLSGVLAINPIRAIELLPKMPDTERAGQAAALKLDLAWDDLPPKQRYRFVEDIRAVLARCGSRFVSPVWTWVNSKEVHRGVKNVHVHLANPRGFCAGVDRAIGIVERALELFGAPIYVHHEVVHNRFVVDDLRSRGVIFVEELNEVPDGTTIIFSAHGVSRAVQEEAVSRGLKVFDATCPLVTKIHMEVTRHSRAGREVILIGHVGHPEVEGTMGQYDDSQGGHMYLVEKVEDVWALQVSNAGELAYVTQTTLSVDDTAQIISALHDRFPTIQGPHKDDICYATQNRQDAVMELSQRCELLLVVSSHSSFNSNRLRELAEKNGTPTYLIDGPEDINSAWLMSKTAIGVTADASAPEVIVQQVLARLRELGVGNANRDSFGIKPLENKSSVIFYVHFESTTEDTKVVSGWEKNRLFALQK